jgi:thymidine phosphorylase
VLQLGAGRRRTDDVIDPAAGIDRLVQTIEMLVESNLTARAAKPM